MDTHRGRCLQLRQAEFLGTEILSGTLPGTPFLRLSAVLSPFWSPSLCPLYVIRFHLSHDCYWEHYHAQACLFSVHGSIFRGNFRAFLLGVSYALHYLRSKE